MPVTLRISELLSARGLTGYQLHKRSRGRLSLSTANRLARNEASALRLDVIETLCDVLGVEPGDLYARD